MRKNFLISLLFSFSFLSVLWIGLFYWQFGTPTPDTQWPFEVIAKKSSAAQNIRTPKIILAGGSGCHFGLKAKVFQNQLGTPTVNLCSHAGLQLPYLLHIVQQNAKKGDFVYLQLEYSEYGYTGQPNTLYSDYLVARDNTYFENLPPLTRLKIIFGLEFRRLAKGLLYRFKAPPLTTSGYQATTTDDFGDETNHSVYDLSQKEIEKRDHLHPIETNFPVTGESQKIFLNFKKWCELNQIRLVIGYPGTMRFDKYEKSESEAFFKRIHSFLGDNHFRVVGLPQMYFYPKSHFYDTVYHLGLLAATEHTYNVVNRLKKNPEWLEGFWSKGDEVAQ